MLTPATSYEALCDAFDWALPERRNMATQACDRWADELQEGVAGCLLSTSAAAGGTAEEE